MSYYFLDGIQKKGPYSLEELKARNLSPETLVLNDEVKNWTPLKELAELKSISNSRKRKGLTQRVLTSESFIEKVFLLILTIFLSGLLIPYVTNEIQRNKAKTETLRTTKNTLLEDISSTLMTYETLLMDVSWYMTRNGFDTAMHNKAFHRYIEQSQSLLSKWRVQSLKARSLMSYTISQKLDEFQLQMFRKQDAKLHELHRKNASKSEWTDLHKVNAQMLFEAGRLISEIATEM